MRPLAPTSPAFLLLLGALTGMTALSIDLSLPALPLLTSVFHVTADRAQLTLSLFLAGFALGQFLVGPTSDRFGRRPVLLVGLLAFTLAGFGCATSGSIGALIAWRFVQGMAASVGPVLGRAAVRDCFSSTRAAQMLSTLMAVLAVAPLVAPILGAQLLKLAGFRAVFGALGVAGLLLFALVTVFFGETLRARDPLAIAPRRLATNVAAFLQSRASLSHAIVIFFVFGAQFSYISASPFVIIEVFGVAPERYGLFFGGTAACLIVGASINGRLVSRIAPARLLRAGLLAIVGVGVALTAVTLSRGGLFPTIAPLFGFFFALGFVFPNATAAALEPMRERAGVASAMLGVFQMTGGALAGWAVSHFYDRSARPMAFSVAALGLLAFVAHTALRPRPT